MQESDKMISEEIKSLEPSEKAVVDGKKARKQFEWTPKRKEAFDKMRKGLEEKVSITKQLKEEKRRSEKEAIKSKVKEIMSSKKGIIHNQETGDSSSSSSEEEEIPKVVMKKEKKSKKEKKEVFEIASPPTKKEKKRRAEVVVQSSSSEEESEEEEAPVRGRDASNYTDRQVREYQNAKVERGKVVRRAQFVNPLDRFILL